MPDGRVMIVGGVSTVGGAPLRSTEFLNLSSGSTAGPPLVTARRWHAASLFQGGLLVSGGFGATGDPLDSIEFLDNGAWKVHPQPLPAPTAQHLQFSLGSFEVFATVGNLDQKAARITDLFVTEIPEADARFRAQGYVSSDGRAVVVAGDTRSISIHDFASETSWLARDLLFDRRGAFSLTQWGASGRMRLAAGGFQISAGGRAIRSLELIEYLPNVGGRPDAVVYTVTATELPIPFAGHVGFNDPSGATVLAGGIGDGGDNSRRVVMILDDRTTPPLTCR
jgi:hypothetical protein